MSPSSDLRSVAILFGLLLLALSFLLPGHYPPWSSFEQQWLAALGCLVLVSGGLIVRQNSAWPPISLLAMASALLPWIQWFTGKEVYLGDAVLSSNYLLAFGLCLLAGRSLRDLFGDRFLHWLLFTLVISASLSVLAAVLQWLHLNNKLLWVTAVPPTSTPFANLGQRNHLATLCAMAVAATLALHANRALRREAMIALLTWLSFGLILAQSRTGWVAITAGGLATIGMRLRVKALPSPQKVLACLGIVLTCAAFMPTISQALLLSEVQNFSDRIAQETGRLTLWANLTHAALLSPWTGYGFNQIALAQQAATVTHPTFRMSQDSHNLLIDLIIWGGIPFALLWAATIALSAKDIIKHCDTPGIWWASWVLGAVLIHSLLEYPHTYTYFLFPSGILMGWLTRTGIRFAPLKWNWLFRIAPLALVASVFYWITLDYSKIESSTRDLRFYLRRIGSQDAPALPEVGLLDMQREYEWLLLTQASPDMTPSDLQRMEHAAKRFPYPPALMRYALAAALNDQPEAARITLINLCGMSVPDRCTEARQAWGEAQAKWTVLQKIDFPALPWREERHPTPP